MSSNESSGAPAEASATTPAPSAAFPSFGSTRGSGLARGKRPSAGPAAAASAASPEYTPTAIEVVTAPREYQNPFAPAETPAAVTAEPVSAAVPAPVAPAPVAPIQVAAAVEIPAPVHTEAAVEVDEPAELNILEPAQQKTVPAQTWESEGFRPAREARTDRPRREEPRREEPRREERPERAARVEQTPFDPSTIPAKFLYVRPGYNYVPTPSNYGGAPRGEHRGGGEQSGGPAASPAPAAPAFVSSEKSGGFFGWLKSLFGGKPAAPAVAEARQFEPRNGDRQRGGRGRGQGGGDGQRRRNRGGRGRGAPRGEYGEGGARSGGPAN